MVTVLIGIIISSFVVILDQVSKIFMVYHLMNYSGFEQTIIENFFSFKLTFNTGAAFSSFSNNFALLMIITVVATLIFVFMARYADFKTKKFYSFGIYFVFGGMFGNFIDRAFAQNKDALFGIVGFAPEHGVTDFISFHFFPAIFNIADTFLTIGVIMILIDLIFFERKREHGHFEGE